MISVISKFHQETGKSVSVLSLVEDAQLPTDIISGQDMTVDQFLVQAKAAAGGDIIPTLNLDYYTSGGNITSHSYCDPKNSTNCGPRWFWQTSAELLNLTAVKNGGREVLLDSWATFSRFQTPQTIQSVLLGLKQQGWIDLIMKQGPSNNTPFPDWGYASYMEMTTQCQNTPPYCFENQGIIAKEWAMDGKYLKGVFGMFDYQIIGTSSFAVFMTNLTVDQQAAAITSLASSQSTGYTYVYPVILQTVWHGQVLYWDSSTALQSNGTPFISLEIDLAKTY